MNRTRDIFITAFALFSLFFGAGNLILPPFLGFQAGSLWWVVTTGFCFSAVLIPIFGILAHARLQGTIFDFGKKVSPMFSLAYSFLVYAISISLPSPRTAAVTHEMAIAPLLNSSALVTSIVYFVLVFLFVINRSKLLNIIGKLLTPGIILILLLIIGITLGNYNFVFEGISMHQAFSKGILEGYQTFDAIGAVVVGGVVSVSINLRSPQASYEQKKKLVQNAGWLAGLGLFLIYTGLIVTGALTQESFAPDIGRTGLLAGVSQQALGNAGTILLSILVSLACFTTAVGIVAGTADFVKHRFKNSNQAYRVTAVIGCLFGVVMGQFNVGYIIAVALPALMFIYPITIVLILLNVIPEKLASIRVFRVVVFTTIVFSIPDFLGSVGLGTEVQGIQSYIPLSQFSMGWVIPSFIAFCAMNLADIKN